MTPRHEEALKFIEIAERDRRAFRVLAASPDVDFVVAGFHAQQAVEKALKAVLIDGGIEFKRTHDLQLLADCIVNDLALSLPVIDADLRLLTPFAVEARYQTAENLAMQHDEIAGLIDAVLEWARKAVTG